MAVTNKPKRFKSLNHRRHWLMWNEVAQTGCWKQDTAIYEKHGIGCFACEERRRFIGTKYRIYTYCPISWVKGKESKNQCICLNPNGLYAMYKSACSSGNIKDAKKYARKIRDAKWTLPMEIKHGKSR